MTPLMLLIIALIWLVATCWRVYRQARFYQIEEYMSLRYLRWLLSSRRRWLPARPALAWFTGAALTFAMPEAWGTAVFALVGIAAALVAAPQPLEGEVKKGFRATDRAKRMLGAAVGSAALGMAIFAAALALLLGSAAVLTSDISAERLRFVLLETAAFFVFLLAPLWLIAGNLLMTPVEALFRRRFIARARHVLDEVHPVVIGVTGSYGKTTTKTFIAHMLNGRYKAYATPKSYNTLMGVCIAINNDIANDRSIDYFIAEMGAYIPGEIARLCDLTRPIIGVVIDVGPQHLERFGSLENVAIAKYELVQNLPPDGAAFFNWDSPHVRAMYKRGYPATRIAVSREIDPASAPPDGPRFIASEIEETLTGLRFTVTDKHTGESQPFETPVLGAHNITNILLAAAVAVHEGMPLREVARRARGLRPAESRLVRQAAPGGITIINDAYSANPVGAVSALRVLGMHEDGRRLLITPGMVELGEMMERENRKLGETAAQYATDVILVGERQAEPIKAGLLTAGFPPERLQVMKTLAESIEWYKNNLRAGDAVLFLNDLPDTYSS